VTRNENEMHPPRIFRGSRARLSRIDARALTPTSIWILFGLSLGAAFTLLACLASLPLE